MDDIKRCAYCGENHFSVSTHSGVLECRRCWNHRKLDRPAASHWVKVLEPLFSNVDFYDQAEFFPDAGVSAYDLLGGSLQLLVRSQFLLKYGPEHVWPETVWNLLGGQTPLIDIAFPAAELVSA